MLTFVLYRYRRKKERERERLVLKVRKNLHWVQGKKMSSLGTHLSFIEGPVV